MGERGVELGQGRIRGGEDEEGREAEGVKGVRRARSMEVTPSAASDGDE